jgi:hypothetical protein
MENDAARAGGVTRVIFGTSGVRIGGKSSRMECSERTLSTGKRPADEYTAPLGVTVTP